MRSVGWRVGVALAAVVAVASASDASAGRRKPNLFEQLFGVSPSQQASPPQRHGSGKDWWQSNDIYGGGDVQIINQPPIKAAKRKPMAVPADTPDPEVGTDNFGMGNLAYVPERVVSLAVPGLKAPRPDDAAASAVYDALADKGKALRVSQDIHDAMLAQYAVTTFKPLWFTDGKLEPRAIAVLKQMATAAEDGLQPSAYLPADLADYASADSFVPEDAAAAAQFDIALTAAALKYAHDMSGGQFDPRRLSQYNDIAPEWVPAAKSIKVLAFSPYPDTYLKGLAPQLPAYGQMKAALAEVNATVGTAKPFTPIMGGKRVKLGQSDGRIPAIRERLADLLNRPDLNDGTLLLDSDLADALKEFQTKSGLKASGLIEPQTIVALNGHDAGQDRKRLVYNMERIRWLPKQLGGRYVLVNQAGFEVQVMDGTQQVWKSKVIIGKPMTQTAVFNNNIQTVVFNPSWGVPASIIAKEYLAKLQRDPSYLDKIGFQVTTPEGTQIASADVDWWSYTGKIPYNVQQPPGGDNALGELKFLFPNAHNIYMHDTPSRELFAQNVRAFSHGCVRVENPRDYATVLLGWDRGRVDAMVESGQTQSVKLPHPVPIHITYFTAWPDEAGKMRYFGDIYGRDKAMADALTLTTVALR